MSKLWYVYPKGSTAPMVPFGLDSHAEAQVLAGMLFADPAHQAEIRHEYEHDAQQVAA